MALLVVPLQMALIPILKLYSGLSLYGTFVGVSNSMCTVYPNTSAFTIADTATRTVSTPFCTTQLPAGSGKPNQPVSTFDGQPSGGTWTVTVVDVNTSATQGSWNGWTLQINHANPTVTAAKAPFKAKGKIALTATCDADCTVTTGGRGQGDHDEAGAERARGDRRLARRRRRRRRARAASR